MPGVSQARICAATRLDLRRFDRLPSIFGDAFAAWSSHCFEDMDKQRVVETLHLHEINDMLDVHEQLSSLQVFIGLLVHWCQ